MIGLLLRCSLLAAIAAGGSPPAGPQPVEVARSNTYSEGPVFDYEGNLYFSHRQGISRLAPDGRLSLWVENSQAGFSGHKVLPDGTHLVCAAGYRAVVRLDRNGKLLSKASTECDGQPLRAPNDLTLAAVGGFYFSDPGGSRTAPIGTVHYVDREGKTHLAAGGMWVPNGLVLSPDGSVLYVAETEPNRILKFRVAAPGNLGPAEVFASLPSRPGHKAEPDGMAVDADGNLYVAHLGVGAVQVLSPAGKLLRTVPAGNYDASNLVFGGPDLSRLYVTGSTGHRSNTAGRVYLLDLRPVRGVSSLLPRP